MPQKVAPKRYGLFVLAILLFLFAGVGIYLGSHNYAIRMLGLAALIAGVYLVRISRVHNRPGWPEGGGTKNFNAVGGPGRLAWIIALSMVPLLCAAYYLMYIDAANGGHEAWPADVFAGVGVACVIAWGYLVTKLVGGGTGK
jgi:hypothetical protein